MPTFGIDAAVLVLGLVLSASTAVAEEPTLFNAVQPRILHGTPTAAFPEVCGVGVRTQNGALGVCSGTLIAPTVVLTAAHCLLNLIEAGAVCQPGDGSRLEIFARDWVAHPEYQGRPHADIGLIFLGSAMGSILPAPLPSERPTHRRGDLVGFGVDGADTRITKRVGSITLLRRCPRKGRPRAGLLRGDLADSLCWKPKPGGVDTCVGDSGGPLFIDGKVVGVTSAGITRSPIGCPGTLSWSTDVSRFRAWIDVHLAAEAAR